MSLRGPQIPGPSSSSATLTLPSQPQRQLADRNAVQYGHAASGCRHSTSLTCCSRLHWVRQIRRRQKYCRIGSIFAHQSSSNTVQSPPWRGCNGSPWTGRTGEPLTLPYLAWRLKFFPCKCSCSVSAFYQQPGKPPRTHPLHPLYPQWRRPASFTTRRFLQKSTLPLPFGVSTTTATWFFLASLCFSFYTPNHVCLFL